jgi:monovalent cation/proton antiporter MnhG/PhaG subunit
MSPHEITVDVLLGIGVAAQLVCCFGVLLGRDVFDRLHYSAAASTVGPVSVAVAILLDESISSAGISTLVTVAFLLLLTPATTIAIARAAHPRGLRLGEDE